MNRWRAIEGHRDYEVSDCGQIRSSRGIMRSNISHNGYPRICIQGETYFVHRLVANAFIGKRPSGHQVNHKSGIKTDNRASNLEYCTPSENRKHAFRIGLQSNKGEQHSRAKLKDSDVITIHSLLRCGVRQTLIAKMVGIDQPSISKIKNGHRWSHVRGGA